MLIIFNSPKIKGDLMVMKKIKKACGTCVSKTKKPAAKKLTQIDKAFTKGEIAAHLACAAELKKAEAVELLETLSELIELHLSKRGPGEFTLPGLAKFRLVRKPATKARKGVNPFTGEAMMFAAKPARSVVKIRPLKRLKDNIG